jgi:hypothetical protein
MRQRDWRKIAMEGGIFLSLVLISIVLVRCGGSSTVAGMGADSVTISDPPSCTNQFTHVYVTVTGVTAHTSASAGPTDAGWQNLTSQLSTSNPVQLDLLNLSASGTQQPIECLLKQLGSDQSLPVGSYQQIRLMLANNGASLPSGMSNNCSAAGSGVVDCVEDSSGHWYPLDLSSQDQTGLKIPPGQIMGGPINVATGKTVDININFNTCSSLVADPANNSYRLKPTLTASQVSPNTSGVSGTVVSGTVVTSPSLSVTAGATGIADATVNLELPSTGPTDSVNGGASTDTIFDTAVTDSNGNFYFCPLSAESGGLDVVADAPAQSSGTTAGATIIKGVPNGAKLNVPIVTQGGTTNSPGTFTVTLNATSPTASGATGTFPVDIDLFPMQLTASTGGYEFIVPLLNGSSGGSVTLSCPSAGGTCTPTPTTSSLVVPANAPLVGSFNSSGGTVTWNSAPSFVSTSASTGSYVIQADGSVGNSPAHTCSTVFTSPVTATAGSPTTVTVTLSGCK